MFLSFLKVTIKFVITFRKQFFYQNGQKSAFINQSKIDYLLFFDNIYQTGIFARF